MPIASCPLCHREPREDDQLQAVQPALGGMTHACRGCAAEIRGEPVNDPTYPHGEPVPTIHDGMMQRHIRVCGVCRRALRFSDPDKTVRLTADDLSEAYQAAFEAAIAGAKTLYADAIRQAEAEYAQAVAPFARERDEQVADLESRVAADRLAAEQAAPDADGYRSLLQTVEALYQRELASLWQLFETDTAAAKGALDGAKFRAGRSYRQAVVAAHDRCKHLIGEPGKEPGAYTACRECLDRYRPRIHARHVRNFVLNAHDAVNDNYLL